MSDLHRAIDQHPDPAGLVEKVTGGRWTRLVVSGDDTRETHVAASLNLLHAIADGKVSILGPDDIRRALGEVA